MELKPLFNSLRESMLATCSAPSQKVSAIHDTVRGCNLSGVEAALINAKWRTASSSRKGDGKSFVFFLGGLSSISSSSSSSDGASSSDELPGKEGLAGKFLTPRGCRFSFCFAWAPRALAQESTSDVGDDFGVALRLAALLDAILPSTIDRRPLRNDIQASRSSIGSCAIEIAAASDVSVITPSKARRMLGALETQSSSFRQEKNFISSCIKALSWDHVAPRNRSSR